jgi:hypothetical protein
MSDVRGLNIMIGGLFVAAFGAAGLILPHFGIQLRLINIFGSQQKPISIGLIALGLVLVVVGRVMDKRSDEG